MAETPLFIRQTSDVWNDAKRTEFIDFVAANATDGDIIPGTGGIRKLRWRRPGSGKRGGVRLIYVYDDSAMPLYLSIVVEVPAVRTIRKKLVMSQKQFAQTYRIPLATLKNWEQGRRHPDAPAAAYLQAIARCPREIGEA